MVYLYENLLTEFGKRSISNVPIPSYITDNLNPKFALRPYQREALQYFMYCNSNEYYAKPKQPYHYLFNMATGSGKTLIMASLILLLYAQGLRNFLFFVNSNNIIKKTKDNFLSKTATKYLFNTKIVIEGREVYIKEVNSFDEADDQNINIKFTTIQQLHLDLNDTKENSITFEDLENKNLVLIADEAHHLSSATKNKGLFYGSWEETVEKVLNSNLSNILLEFTATLDYERREIVNKYKDKVIYKYDLSQFRLDKYSKEINLIRSQYDEKDRITQALVLNLYRQELAALNNVNLKPVILFKAKRTIVESESNKESFHILIENLSHADIERIKETSTVNIVNKAFAFFETNKIETNEIAKRIQSNFRNEYCISANNDLEAERNQVLLNTLEDENNPIRAIFAVQKLNEGWDVLNLFDIVRLYEERDVKNNKPGKTTISEAQLIGRGARYFPFALSAEQDKFTRKYDSDVSNELKILEELYYHTKEDSRYISELKAALIETGIYEERNLITKSLRLKDEFKDTTFYRDGQVFYNLKVPKNYKHVKSFADLNVKRVNYRHILSSGIGRVTGAFDVLESAQSNIEISKGKDIKLHELSKHITRFALSMLPFYRFNVLTHYFPNIQSITQFIESSNYLASLEITFVGTEERLLAITQLDYLQALIGLLQNIELDIKKNTTEFEASEYVNEPICNVFKDKDIKVDKDDERAKGQEDLVASADWYAYNANYGTSEEKKFVDLFARRFGGLKRKFDSIYIIRNERALKIYDNMGRGYEPDFLLFCKKKNGEQMTYQVFIEPKGAHLQGSDKWKEELLNKIRKDNRFIEIHLDKYLITALPFYNSKNENDFNAILESTLGIE